MEMAFDYHIIKNARDAIDHADNERRKQGISQMLITERADFPDVGQTYARFFGSGEGKLSKYIKIENALGFEIVAVPGECMDVFIECMDAIKAALNKREGQNGESRTDD